MEMERGHLNLFNLCDGEIYYQDHNVLSEFHGLFVP